MQILSSQPKIRNALSPAVDNEEELMNEVNQKKMNSNKHKKGTQLGGSLKQ